jgi:hypothetical protein
MNERVEVIAAEAKWVFDRHVSILAIDGWAIGGAIDGWRKKSYADIIYNI